MKKTAFAMALLLLAACGKDEEKVIDHATTDWAYFGLKGNVKSISEKSVSVAGDIDKSPFQREDPAGHNTDLEFNEEGQLILEKKWMDDGKPYEETKYKGREKKLEHVQFMSGTPATKTLYGWDKNGNNISILRSNPDNTQLGKVTMTYKNGKLTEKITYSNQDYVTDRIKYFYDKEGNLLGESLFLNKEDEQYRNTFEYNEDKKVVVANKYKKGGELVSKTLYEYERGRLDKMEYYNDKGEREFYERFTYDNKGNILTHTAFDKFEDAETREQYAYDEKGNKLGMIIYKDDEPVSRAMYQYDKNNNNTLINVTNETGEITDSSSYTYEYDKKGNWTKKTVYKKDKPAFVITRKIEYFD